jgi:hypothetical protein
MIAGLDLAAMVDQRKRSEATAHLPDGVSARTAQASVCAVVSPTRRPVPSGVHAPGRPELAVVAGRDTEGADALPDEPPDFDRDLLLARDVIDIAEARDALLANPSLPLPQNLVSPSRGLARTADSVPIILGALLGVLMGLVFATAALFTNFAR